MDHPKDQQNELFGQLDFQGPGSFTPPLEGPHASGRVILLHESIVHLYSINLFYIYFTSITFRSGHF